MIPYVTRNDFLPRYAEAGVKASAYKFSEAELLEAIEIYNYLKSERATHEFMMKAKEHKDVARLKELREEVSRLEKKLGQ